MEEVQLLIYIGTAFVLVLALAVLSTVLYAHKKRNQIRIAMHQQEIAFHKELNTQTIQAHEEERQRIGMELHDDLGQSLTYMLIKMKEVHGEQAFPTELDQELNEITTTLNQAIDKCSSISKSLYPIILKRFGLKDALQQLILEAQDRSNFELTSKIDEVELDKSNQLHIYRICQELLNNALKHAEATHVQLQLTNQDNHMLLHYKDDGKGFDPNQRNQGLGLSNIKTRASGLNAELKTKSAVNQGYELNLIIPHE